MIVPGWKHLASVVRHPLSGLGHRWEKQGSLSFDRGVDGAVRAPRLSTFEHGDSKFVRLRLGNASEKSISLVNIRGITVCPKLGAYRILYCCDPGE